MVAVLSVANHECCLSMCRARGALDARTAGYHSYASGQDLWGLVRLLAHTTGDAPWLTPLFD